MTRGGGSVDLEAAVAIVSDLAAEHHARTGRPVRCVVAFGGTALAAHRIRPRSDDVDVYMTDIDDRAVEAVTARHRPTHGAAFKIDATPGDTLFGQIALKDIERSPEVRRLETPHGPLAFRALSIETMYLLKTLAGRPKDILDLPGIADRTSYARIADRLAETIPWFVDRSAMPAHLEALSRGVSRDFMVPPDRLLAKLPVSDDARARIAEIHAALGVRMTHEIRNLMRARPELISFDAARPEVARFDFDRARADPTQDAFAKANAAAIRDMAAEVLREADPRRHLARMKAVVDRRRPEGRDGV